MIPLHQMKIIQIDITNACRNKCSNCTRLIGHHRKPFFMDFETFKRAVDSLEDFPGMVGTIGGEPLLHPEFEKFARYLQHRVADKKRRGLWSTIPREFSERYGELIKDVYGNLYLNDHSIDAIMHQPVLVAAQDVLPDREKMWSLIENCWVQTYWSATITPKGAFFCEVAASFDMLFDGPGGWPVEPGWWRREPNEFGEQKQRWCPRCGCAVPLPRRRSTQEVDDVSDSNLKELRRVGSPKVRANRVEVFSGDSLSEDWSPHPNWYMSEVEEESRYRKRIADRLDSGAPPVQDGNIRP